MQGFKKYLLVEQGDFLAQKLGDILSALQSAVQDSPNMGNRHKIKVAETIIDSIRKVLNGQWSKEEEAYLVRLQRVGVSLAKAIDSNEKMDEVLASAKAELEHLSSKLGSPVNSLASG